MPSIDYNYHPDVPRDITNALIEHLSVYRGEFNGTLTRDRIKSTIREYQRELLLSIGYKLDLGVHFSPDGVTLVPLPQDIHIMPRLIVSDESWIVTPPRIKDRFTGVGRRLSQYEKDRVAELNNKYRNEDVSHWPYPKLGTGSRGPG